MVKEYQDQWVVHSSSGKGNYIVSQNFDGSYECGCRGWTGHMPRTDCRHIRSVRAGEGRTISEAVMDRLTGEDGD